MGGRSVICMCFFLLSILQKQFRLPVSICGKKKKKEKVQIAFVDVIYGASLEKNT